MILCCGACSAQNFVSPERLAVREIPPRCWGCGRELLLPGAGEEPCRETRENGKESKQDENKE